jgi:uncharacterized protein DUF4236
MSFKFRKRIKIVRGFAINLSKGWPSLLVDADGSIIDGGRHGSRTNLGNTGTGLSWQFGAQRHIHKAVQVQADVKAVHAQGTSKAVRAQADIILITKRMEALAKRLARNAAGNDFWKKAAIEQAQLLDRMLDVAKASENDQLVAAVRKCHKAWGDGNPHYREALDSGMTITDCLANVLASRPSVQCEPANLLNCPQTSASKVNERAVPESSASPGRLAPQEKRARPLEGAALWPFWRTVFGRNILPPVIGFVMGAGMISVVYLVAPHKTKSHPSLVDPAPPPLLKQPAAMPTARIPAATPTPESQTATPTPSPLTPTPAPVQATAPLLPREPGTQGKALRKHPIHNSARSGAVMRQADADFIRN